MGSNLLTDIRDLAFMLFSFADFLWFDEIASIKIHQFYFANKGWRLGHELQKYKLNDIKFVKKVQLPAQFREHVLGINQVL